MKPELISRQEAIDHFQSIINATEGNGDYKTGFVDGLNFCIDFLKYLPSPVEEKYISSLYDACIKSINDMNSN